MLKYEKFPRNEHEARAALLKAAAIGGWVVHSHSGQASRITLHEERTEPIEPGLNGGIDAIKVYEGGPVPDEEAARGYLDTLMYTERPLWRRNDRDGIERWEYSSLEVYDTWVEIYQVSEFNSISARETLVALPPSAEREEEFWLQQALAAHLNARTLREVENAAMREKIGGGVGRHLSNIQDPTRPDASKLLILSRGMRQQDAWALHMKWVNANIIGPPQATAYYTREQMEAKGMVGLYALKQEEKP